MKIYSTAGSREALGHYLREKRQEAGVSQVELARVLNYSSQFIANWERGASMPPANVIRKIVRTLKIPEKEILELLYQQCAHYWEEVILGKRSTESRSKNN